MATANSEQTKQVKLDDDFFDDIFGDETPDKSFYVDDEDGDFKVGKVAVSPKTQEDVQDEEDDSEKVADASDSAAEEKTEPSEPSALDKRVSSLESSVNKLIDLVEKQSNLKQTQDVDEDEEEEDFDFNPKSFRKMIQEEIKGALKPLQQSQAEQTQKELLTQDFNKTAAKYGDDFTRLGPVIQELATQSLLSDPNANAVFEAAYQKAKSFEKVFNPAKSDSTKQPEVKPKKTIDATTLKEKVKALETQEGVSKTGGRKSIKINNVREAFDETIEELFGSAGFEA